MFCPSCRSLMRPVEGVVTCVKCGTTKDSGAESVVVKSAIKEDVSKGVIVDPKEDKKGILPTTHAVCESDECDNEKAYYFFRQTRAADEATTRFMECTECGHRWRDYR